MLHKQHAYNEHQITMPQALASSQSTVAAFSSASQRQKAASNWPSQPQGTLVAALADLLQGLQLDPDETSGSTSTLSSRNVADALRCSQTSH